MTLLLNQYIAAMMKEENIKIKRKKKKLNKRNPKLLHHWCNKILWKYINKHHKENNWVRRIFIKCQTTLNLNQQIDNFNVQKQWMMNNIVKIKIAQSDFLQMIEVIIKATMDIVKI